MSLGRVSFPEKTVLTGTLIAGALVFSFPFLWMISTSVKLRREMAADKMERMTFIPETPRPQTRSPYIGSGQYDLALLGREPVDSGYRDGLDGGRHLNTLDRFGQTIEPWFTDEDLSFHQSSDGLLKKERVTLGLLDQVLLEGPKTFLGSNEAFKQLFTTLGRQGVDPELCIVGFPSPPVLVFGAIVDKEQHACRRQALNQAV